MSLSRRQNTILVDQSSSPEWGQAYTINVCAVGARANTASGGATVTVDGGHSIRVGDKCLLWDGSSAIFTVAATVASATSVTFSTSSYSISAGDLLVNLGPDTGTSTPNYDASWVGIYKDPDGGTRWTNATLTTNSTGNYSYYHRGDGRMWEVVRNSGGTVVAVIDGYGGGAGRHNVCDYGAIPDAATDTRSSIQAACLAAENEGTSDRGGVVYFPAAQYSYQVTSSGGTEDSISYGIIFGQTRAITFTGAGYTRTKIRADVTLDALLYIPNTTRTNAGEISDLYLEDNSPAAVDYMIYIRRCRSWMFRDIRIKRFAVAALRMGSAADAPGSPYATGFFNDIWIDGDSVEAVRPPTGILLENGANDSVWRNILIQDISTTGILHENNTGGQSWEQVHIFSNDTSEPSIAIDIRNGGSHSSFVNVYLDKIVDYGMRVGRNQVTAAFVDHFCYDNPSYVGVEIAAGVLGSMIVGHKFTGTVNAATTPISNSATNVSNVIKNTATPDTLTTQSTEWSGPSFQKFNNLLDFFAQGGITASGTQTQAGGTALVRTVNVVNTVSIANDACTLPEAVAGRFVFVANHGGNSMRLFPAVDDQINTVAVDAKIDLADDEAILLFAKNGVTWSAYVFAAGTIAS